MTTAETLPITEGSKKDPKVFVLAINKPIKIIKKITIPLFRFLFESIILL
jgi:hypothetical protein